MDTYKTRLKDITTFIFDVDGVMTNGKIIYTHDGKIDRQFNAKDGYAIKHAISKGYRIAIISEGMKKYQRLLMVQYLGYHHPYKEYSFFPDPFPS